MHLEIRSSDVKITKTLQTFIKQRVTPALERFSRRIRVVRVYIQDIDGPRGGLGKTCRIVVELPPRGRIVVSGIDTDIGAAITCTASRAGIAVKRHLKRRLAGRRSSHHGVRGQQLVSTGQDAQ